jgi:hypothetical protein
MKSKFVGLLIVTSILIYSTNGYSKNTKKKKKTAATCTAYSIVANEKKGKIHKDLKIFSKKFKKMPFKLFKTFDLKKKSSLQLSKKISKAKISDKYEISIKLLDRILGKKNKIRFRIKLIIGRKVKKKGKTKFVSHTDTVLKLAANKIMFYSGLKAKGGTLIFGLICK